MATDLDYWQEKIKKAVTTGILGTADNKQTKMIIQLEQEEQKLWQPIAELDRQIASVGLMGVVTEKYK